MGDVYILLKLFGERYIHCDDEQAQYDAMPENREDLVCAFQAIQEFIRLKMGGDDS